MASRSGASRTKDLCRPACSASSSSSIAKRQTETKTETKDREDEEEEVKSKMSRERDRRQPFWATVGIELWTCITYCRTYYSLLHLYKRMS